jgi:hypothetical protein
VLKPGESSIEQVGPDLFEVRWIEGRELRYVEHRWLLTLDELACWERGETFLPAHHLETFSLEEQISRIRADIDQKRARIGELQRKYPGLEFGERDARAD